MVPSEPRSRMMSFWGFHLSGWLVFAATTVIFSYTGRWTDIGRLLPYLLPYAVGCLTCLPLRRVYKGVRLSERPWPNMLATGMLVSFAGAHVWMGVDLAISLFVHQAPYIRSGLPFARAFPSMLYRRAVPLLIWTILYLGIKIQRDWKEQRQKAEKAAALAQAAQLQMLRYQLNPHFLFNSMNSIRALIDEDETKARELITELSEFLRYSLESKDASDVPLRHELEAIRHYFAIQKKRYEDKLEVVYDIEPEAGDVPIPSFLVHPLVENAVKYGMRTSPLPLLVRLEAKVEAGSLRVEVSNTGRWVEPGGTGETASGGTGTGLENVRHRLENAFPGRHRFEIIEKDGGVHIYLEIRSLGGTRDGASA
jgi:signal transduction histidine kinase